MRILDYLRFTLNIWPPSTRVKSRVVKSYERWHDFHLFYNCLLISYLLWRNIISMSSRLSLLRTIYSLNRRSGPFRSVPVSNSVPMFEGLRENIVNVHEFPYTGVTFTECNRFKYPLTALVYSLVITYLFLH